MRSNRDRGRGTVSEPWPRRDAAQTAMSRPDEVRDRAPEEHGSVVLSTYIRAHGCAVGRETSPLARPIRLKRASSERRSNALSARYEAVLAIAFRRERALGSTRERSRASRPIGTT